MRPRHTAAALTAAALLMAGLTACGPTGSSTAPAARPSGTPAEPDPKALLAAAALVMDKAGGARVNLAGPDASDSGAGWAGWKGQRTLELTVQEDGENVQSRLLDGTAYLGLSSKEQVDGKQWLRVDLKSPGSAAEDPDLADAVGSFATVTELLDPVGLLNATAKTGKVTTAGQETVGGAHTVHIKATADADALTAGLFSYGPDFQKLVADSLKQDGDTAVVEFWLDDQNQLVKESVSSGDSDAVTVTFRDLGSTEPVTAPPADQTAAPEDLTES